jgi:hypothetical protein
MVASGIINAEGEVLVTKEEREAGRPLPDSPEECPPAK